MPIARVQMPDGRIGRFDVPEGTTPEQVISFAEQQGNPSEDAGYIQGRVNAVKNAAQQAVNPDFWKSIGNELTNFPALPVNPQTGKTDFQKIFNDPSLGQQSMGMALSALPVSQMSKASRFLTMKGTPIPTNNVQNLMAEGVTPTIGQAAGGTTQRIEEGLTSVPVLGDVIKNAQRRAVETMNKAAINRTLNPIGESLPKTVNIGNEAVAYAGDKLSQAYDDLLPKLNLQGDSQLAYDVNAVLMKHAQTLPEQEVKQLANLTKDPRFTQLLNGQNISGESMKELDSVLSHQGRAFGSSNNPYHQFLGDAIGELQGTVRNFVQRTNPNYSNELSGINKGWANLVRVEKAAANAKEGVFTGAGLRSAVKATDQSVRKRAFARGQSLMQDLANPAEAVLGSKVPDSGTPFRSLVATGIPGAIASAATLPLIPLYTKTINNLITRGLSRSPNLVRNFPIQRGLLALDAQNQQGILGQ